MAASTQQKVDFLLKKIGYTASKTGLAEDSSLSGTKKAPFAEAVPSPLVIASASVWADSADIPATPPGSDSSYVKVYLSGTSGHHMTVDSTVSGNRSYIAYSTYNNSSTAILGDWIDTQFGASYIIKVYKGDPNSGGVSLSAAGSGSNDGWFFDYSSGILNFNDTNVPSGVTDSNIYIVGYRYIGTKGVIAPGGVSSSSQLNVTGVSTFGGAVDANAGADISGGVGLNVVGHTELDEVNVSGVSTYGGAIDANAGILASTLKVEDLTATRVVLAGTGGEIEDNAKLTFTTDKLAVTGGLTVSAGATFAGIVDGNAGANISGGEATFASATVSDLTDNRVVIAGTSGALEDSGNLTFSGTKLTVTGNAQVTTDLDVDGGANISGGIGLNVVGHTEVDEVNVSGVSTYGGAIDANAGIDVSGHTEVDNVNVSGVSTYGGAADFNAGVDISGGVGLNVVGHTELDEVNASGVSTFAALIDGNAGANISGGSGLVASTAKISDLTDNRVVLAGASGELEDSSKITFDGSTFAIVGGATFTGNVTVGGTLTSEDKTNVDSLGIVTARTGVRITSGGIIVSSGVGTFTDAIDANGGLDVSGGSGLVASSAKISDLTSGRVVVAGTSGELEDASTFTFSGGTVTATNFSGNLTGELQTAAQPNVTSLGTIANLVASRAQVTGVGGLVITGVSTFTGAVDANGGADISGGVGLNVVGHAELDEVNVSGVSTYAGAIDANAGAHISGGIGLEVVGHTEVDNFSASGVSTFAALVDGNAGANFSGAETVLSSATVSDLTENRVVIAGADGALEDASTLTFDGTKLQVGTAITMYQATGIVSASYFYGDGSNLLNAGSLLSASSGVQRIVTTSLTSGTMTSAGTDADLTFDTSSNTLNAGKVNVAGVGTFGGLVDGNAGCNFSGAESTFSSATVSDLTDNRVVIAGASGALEDSGNLTFDGTQLTVTGNAQVTTDLDVNGGANISGGVGLEVVGHTELDNLNVSGVSTYGGAADFNAGVLASTLKVEDLAGARVVVSGTGGEIEDSANLTWVSNGANYLGLTGGLTVSAASTFGGVIDGNAGANFSGAETILSSATVSDLTAGRVVVAGTSGALEDASTFTFSGGTVSATNFSGNLTGTLQTAAQTNITSVGTLTGLTVSGTTATLGNVVVTKAAAGAGATVGSNDAGITTYHGNLTGTLNTAAQTNITSLGTLTGLTVDGDLQLEGDSNKDLLWDKSDGYLEFAGWARATFDDTFQIYKGDGGSDAPTIVDTSGNAMIMAINGGIEIRAFTTGEKYIKATENDATELYFNGSKKIETTNKGAIVTGILTANGTTSTLGNLVVTNAAAGAGATVGSNDAGITTFIGNLTGTVNTAAQTNITSVGTLDGLTVDDDATFNGSTTNMVWDKSDSALEFNNILKIYNTDGDSRIEGSSGGMFFKATGAYVWSNNSASTRFEALDSGCVQYGNGGRVTRTRAGKFEVGDGAVALGMGITMTTEGNARFGWDGISGTGIVTATSFHGSTASFSSDVDIADTLYHTGDTNTSIRFPAADTFTVTTAGTERARIDSNGDLNLGDNPTNQYGYKLNIQDSQILYAQTASSSGTELKLSLDHGNTIANFGTVSSSHLALVTANTDRLRIESDGRVFIGADADISGGSAASMVQVVSGSGSYLSVGRNDTTVAAGNGLGGFRFYSNDTNINSGNYLQVGGISCDADGDFLTGDAPTRLTFSTMTDGTTTLSERMRLDSNGKLLFNHTASRNVGNITAGVQIEGTDSGASLSICRNSNNSSSPYISLAKSRAGSVGGNTVIQDGDGLGKILFSGADGTDITNNAASITAEIDGTPGGNDTPGRLIFATTADGGTSPTEALRITSGSDVLIGGHSAAIDPGAYGAHLEVHGTGLDAGINVLRYSANAFGPTIVLGKSRNGSIGSNTVVQEDDELGKIHFYGTDSSDWEPGASIKGVADGEWNTSSDTTDSPGRLEFYTTPNGSDTLTERFRISADGTADFNENTVQKAVLKNYTETVKAIGNTGTSTTLDLADGNVFTATLNGNCTFTFTTGTNSAPNAASFTLILTNDGSAGRTISWPASVKWPNATQPSRTTAASKTDIWSFMTPDNGTTWYGNIALYNFS